MTGATQASHQGAIVADKSPRQGMSKKSSKSLKEKRADKRAKSSPSESIVDSRKKR